jgi:hypothetical protein
MWPEKLKLDEEKSKHGRSDSKMVLALIFVQFAEAGARHSKV